MPQQPETGMPPDGHHGDASAGTGTVLIVDDQDFVRDVIRLSLEGAGYTVREAASPLDAIAQVREDAAIDLLRSDGVMPAAGSGAPAALRPGLQGRRGGGAVPPDAVHPGGARGEGRRRSRRIAR